MKCLALLFPILLSVFGVLAQSVQQPVAGAYLKLNAYGIHQPDAVNMSAQQASMARAGKFSAGLYAERRYMLNELAHYIAAFSVALDPGRIGVVIKYFGNPGYNESQAGLAYARSIGEMDIGIQFNYFMFSTAGYGRSAAVNFEGGLMIPVHNKFRAGMHVYNPLGTGLLKLPQEHLPTIYSAGMGYELSQHFFIGSLIEKEEGKPVDISVGMQYNFSKKLRAMAGVSTALASFYFGAAIKIEEVRIQVSIHNHQRLGLTPGMSAVFGKEE